MLDYSQPARLDRRGRPGPVLELGPLLRRVDWTLMIAVGALVAYGLWILDGVTANDVSGDPNYYVARQATYAAVGTAGFLVALFVDPDHYRRGRTVTYGLMVATLLVVLVAGVEVRGSTRWLELGGFRFQPSEFGKLLLVVFLAGFLADRGKRAGESRTTLAAVGFALVPAVLVFVQPDVGSALVYGAALGAVLFLAGARWLQLAWLAAGVAAVAVFVLWGGPAMGVELLKPYQVERLTAFYNPSQDPGGATYNVNQSQIAVGAGGVTGRGPSGATQTNLDYLPEHATDFVFASLAEQRGFVGASILLALYLLVVWRALNTVAVARDAFSAIVAGGIAVALLFQIVVNVGMTIGMAPVTGIPLPFVSAGGSSLITNLVAMGILQAIHARGRAASHPIRIRRA
ncbi:MAG: rod shape-determining protein RodA [Thermoleophilia bacterium]|nr:rod shape-determining protein RodA [Thermoleophilia bacterium]